jgi:hypothetical protein
MIQNQDHLSQSQLFKKIGLIIFFELKNIKMYEFIKLGTNKNIIDTFDEQDIVILSKVKSENIQKVKEIIAEYGLQNSLDTIFKNYKNDYENLKIELIKFSNKRIVDLTKLTENFW